MLQPLTDLACSSSNVPLKEKKRKKRSVGFKVKNGGANSIPLTGHTPNAPRGAPDMNQGENRSCWEDVNDTVRTASPHCPCM